MTLAKPVAQDTGHTLRLERSLRAPQAVVWAAWTDPKHLAKWFFPNDVDIVSSDFEPLTKPTWRTVMRGKDSGILFPVQGEFEAVEPPHRLVFTHGWEDETGKVPVMTRVTVNLKPEAGGTRLTFLQEGLSSAKSRDGHCDGWTQTLDNLTGYLST